ncbi:MAG TPA: amidase [Acidobacteriota bacterium]|nr:amidase [Acidobacteriota bacterium]
MHELFDRRHHSILQEARRRISGKDPLEAAACLAGHCIDRIEAFNQRGPCLGAVLEVNAEARSRKRLSRVLPADRERPLWGLPLVIKDNIVTAEDPLNTTCGSHFLMGARYGRDSTLVSRLKRAGALILAKANMPEFGLTAPSARGGPVRNPLDGCRTQPGGSSNGVAVAVAAGMGLAGFGTDARGSLRAPSAECALAGLRPTVGMISRQGVCAFQPHDVVGPIAPSVQDLALLLEAVAAEDDPLDPLTGLYRAARPAGWAGRLRPRGSLAGLRLAKPAGIEETLREEVRRSYRQAIQLMEKAGARFLDIDAGLWQAEDLAGASSHEAALALGGDSLRRFAETWSEDSPIRNLDDLQERFRAPLPTGMTMTATEPDNLLIPLLEAAPLKDALGVWEEVLEGLRAPFAQALQEADAEALVVPTGSWAVSLKGPLSPPLMRHDNAFGVACAWAGLPELVLPMHPGRSHPLGLSLVGLPFSEARLLQLGCEFERLTAPPPRWQAPSWK